eukprot:scaffold58298_cov19-Tisochrysis_lutea.AAC.1
MALLAKLLTVLATREQGAKEDLWQLKSKVPNRPFGYERARCLTDPQQDAEETLNLNIYDQGSTAL